MTVHPLLYLSFVRNHWRVLLLAILCRCLMATRSGPTIERGGFKNFSINGQCTRPSGHVRSSKYGDDASACHRTISPLCSREDAHRFSDRETSVFGEKFRLPTLECRSLFVVTSLLGFSDDNKHCDDRFGFSRVKSSPCCKFKCFPQTADTSPFVGKFDVETGDVVG